MEVLTIDSLDGLRKRGLASVASDYDVVNAQQAVLVQFEEMVEAGQIPQATIDSVGSRVEQLNAQFDALVIPVMTDPDQGVTNEVLTRAQQANPDGWAAYMRNAQAIYDDVRAIVGRERTWSTVRSVAAFTVGAALGALVVHRLT